MSTPGLQQPFFGTQPWNLNRDQFPTTLLPEVHHGSDEQVTGAVGARDLYGMYNSPTPPTPGTPRGSAVQAVLALPDGPVQDRNPEEEGMPQGWGPRLINLDSKQRIMRSDVDKQASTLRSHMQAAETLNASVFQRLEALEKSLVHNQLNASFIAPNATFITPPQLPQQPRPHEDTPPKQPQRFDIGDGWSPQSFHPNYRAYAAPSPAPYPSGGG